jgi:tight adherence protein C
MSGLPTALGMAWGVLAAAPLVGRARRVAPSERAIELRPEPRRVKRTRIRVPVPGAVGRVLGAFSSRRHNRQVAVDIQNELAIVIDLLAVSVSAGCTPYLAVAVASDWAPPGLSARLRRVRRECDLGAGFAEALGHMVHEAPPLSGLVDALLASDRFGAPVGDALGRLALEERAALRRRAETRARTVPVRLLFPLVFLVLPAFGLLTVVPALLSGLGAA